MPIRWNEINPNKGAKLIRPARSMPRSRGANGRGFARSRAKYWKLGMTVVPSLTLYSSRILVAARP